MLAAVCMLCTGYITGSSREQQCWPPLYLLRFGPAGPMCPTIVGTRGHCGTKTEWVALQPSALRLQNCSDLVLWPLCTRSQDHSLSFGPRTPTMMEGQQGQTWLGSGVASTVPLHLCHGTGSCTRAPPKASDPCFQWPMFCLRDGERHYTWMEQPGSEWGTGLTAAAGMVPWRLMVHTMSNKILGVSQVKLWPSP